MSISNQDIDHQDLDIPVKKLIRILHNYIAKTIRMPDRFPYKYLQT